jgi:serine kinase of HPr protein (carbohydrate metabolism regulator)
VSQTVRGTTVAIGGRGILLRGASGSGKSDLALRLIDRGAALVSDDYTAVRIAGGRLIGSAPPAIAGRIEARGLGILEVATVADIPLCLVAELDRAPERLPDGPLEAKVAGVAIPAVALAALEPSAPLKLEAALRLYGLTP